MLINKISTRRPKDFDDENSMLQFKFSRELDAVVKDHDSPAINSLIRAFKRFLHRKMHDQKIQRPMSMKICLEHIHLHQKQNLFAKSRAVFYLVNSKAFGKHLEIASKKLRYDGLRHDFITSHGKASTVTIGLDSGSEVVSTIDKIQRTMKVLNQALHWGEIHGITPGAKYAYVYLMDVETYLHKILTSDELKENIMKHRSATEALLWHPCEIIE